MSSEYRPGTCNIGPAEQRVRYGFGAVSFAVTGAIVVLAVGLSMPQWALLVTIIPLFGGFIGYFQGRGGFCVRYAWAGVYNVSDKVGDRASVPDDDASRQDRRQAQMLVVRAAGAAVIGGVGLYLLVPT